LESYGSAGQLALSDSESYGSAGQPTLSDSENYGSAGQPSPFGLRLGKPACAFRFGKLQLGRPSFVFRFVKLRYGKPTIPCTPSCWRRRLAGLLDPDEVTERDFWLVVHETQERIGGGLPLGWALQDSLAVVVSDPSEWQAEFR
jgi:hypothetical protein